jgi:xylulose-5-phosphate/fructose-6-phosphate phosphoketolase
MAQRDHRRIKPSPFAPIPAETAQLDNAPHANGGLLRRELVMPDFADYAVTVAQPGQSDGEARRVMGVFLRDVIKQNHDFRLFGPDETASNRLSAVFEVTDRAWVAQTLPEDDHLSRDGHVMEILSEHTCEQS